MESRGLHWQQLHSNGRKQRLAWLGVTAFFEISDFLLTALGTVVIFIFTSLVFLSFVDTWIKFALLPPATSLTYLLTMNEVLIAALLFQTFEYSMLYSVWEEKNSVVGLVWFEKQRTALYDQKKSSYNSVWLEHTSVLTKTAENSLTFSTHGRLSPQEWHHERRKIWSGPMGRGTLEEVLVPKALESLVIFIVNLCTTALKYVPKYVYLYFLQIIINSVFSGLL